MARSRTLIIVSTVAVLLALLLESPAAANRIVRRDGNDTKGPLDLASVRVTHAIGANVFQITTIARFTNKQINKSNGFFEVDFDTNADKNPNFFVVVVYSAGRVRGWLFKGNGHRISRKLTAKRSSRRSVRVKVPLAKIRNPQSYDFATFSAYFDTPCRDAHPCIDSIPNRYPLIRHDLTSPTFSWNPAPPTFSTDVSATRAFPVSFTVADDTYGSGVKDWTLQKRAVGTSTWVVVATGTSHTPTRNVTGGVQGASYDLRVIVRDKQGNKTIGPVERTSIPWDDSNAFFTYTSGTWTDGPTTQQFLAGTKQGTSGDIVSFNVVGGHQFCVLGGPGTDDPAATLVVGSDPPQILTETSGTAAREQIHCETPAGTGSIDVVLTVTAGTFVLDAVAVEG